MILIMLDDNESTRKRRSTYLLLSCQPLGDLAVEVMSIFALSDEVNSAAIEVKREWEALWAVAGPALISEVENYGSLSDYGDHKPHLLVEVGRRHKVGDAVVIQLQFPPLAGSFDVTIQGQDILDQGSAF